MKMLPSLAMFLVGLDCFFKGFGISPQNLFAPDATWMWFFAGIGWWVATFMFVVENLTSK